MRLMDDLFPVALPMGTTHLKNRINSALQCELFNATQLVAKSSEISHLTTKSGGAYSAKITSCGTVGWWSDAQGYRYTENDPRSGKPWPRMPKLFLKSLKPALYGTSAEGFEPDACLINHYTKSARMGLHQDKDEADFSHPIITISLGATADFLIGGEKRSDPPQLIIVESGDIVIMGGKSRMRFHSIRKIYPGSSPLANLDGRISLTFRKAL